MNETVVPFAGLAAWLKSRGTLITDRQTCHNLFKFIVHHAVAAGVPRSTLQMVLDEGYAPGSRKPVFPPNREIREGDSKPRNGATA